MKNVLWTLGIVIAFLLVFAIGAAVGYRRALFVSRFGENYYHNFYGMGNMGPMGPMSISMHGVAGEVIDVESSSLSVQDPSGNERSVVVLPTTIIREGDGAIMLDAVEIGNGVTVIGGPNDEGQVEASFIRVFPSSSSMPVGQ